MDSVTLIRTNLYRPRLASDLVERPRLMKRLNRDLERTLTLVAAPAGYGKSVLVARWLETCERPSAWLSLDKNNSDLGVFLRYFIAAVQTLFPDVGRETLALLQAPEPPPIHVLTATLINDLDRVEQPFILAIDDYHQIRDLAVHDLMDGLLRHAPQSLHLALISRLNPPLNFHQLRARGQMVEIRAEDLRFTPDETRAFAQQVWRAPLGEAEAIRLQEKTEGWATGLRLYFLSMKGPDDLNALADMLPGRGLATEYLFHEVFTNQPKAIQDYLLSTSILERFSASLSQHLRDAGTKSGSMSGQAFIDWLQQADIFVIALDHERQWFRYHHLFQGLLERQLAQAYGTEDIARLHRCASEWFAHNGLIEEAIHHALAAGDAMMAGDLVERHRDEMLDTDQLAVLERWLSYLPDEVISQRVGLLLAKLWISDFQFNFAAFPSLLRQLDALLETEDVDPVTEAQRAFFRGIPLFWQGQVEASLECFQRSLSLSSPEDEQKRANVMVYLATAMQVVGQAEEAISTFQQSLLREHKDSMLRGRLLGSLVYVHYISGQLTPASHYTRQVLEMGKRGEDAFVCGWGHFVLGQIHFDWHMLDAAVAHFSQAVRYRYFLEHEPRVESLIGLALAYHGLGREDEADAAMKQLMTILQEYPSSRSSLVARSAEVRLAIARGDMDEVRYLQHTIDFSGDQGSMLFRLELPRITQCRMLIAVGTPSDLEKAGRLLTEHLQFARQTHNTYQQVGILTLMAAVYQRQGRSEKAVDLLSEAVSLAEPGGIVRPFVEVGEGMVWMLKALNEQRQNTSRDFVHRLLGAFPSTSASTPQLQPGTMPLVEPLTEREVDILALLARRYSNKEIADELIISVATVKRHASNIYGKLQVNGRRAAVKKAINMGVITAADEPHYSSRPRAD